MGRQTANHDQRRQPLNNNERTQNKMKETLTPQEVALRLLHDDNANWTPAGALAMAESLVEYEEGSGEEMEFDAVAIRCDFSEYESLQEWAKDYFGTDREGRGWKYHLSISEDADEDEIDTTIRGYVTDRGQLIEFDGGIIVSSF
jgi:hypothetical protein